MRRPAHNTDRLAPPHNPGSSHALSAADPPDPVPDRLDARSRRRPQHLADRCRPAVTVIRQALTQRPVRYSAVAATFVLWTAAIISITDQQHAAATAAGPIRIVGPIPIEYDITRCNPVLVYSVDPVEGQTFAEDLVMYDLTTITDIAFTRTTNPLEATITIVWGAGDTVTAAAGYDNDHTTPTNQVVLAVSTPTGHGNGGGGEIILNRDAEIDPRGAHGGLGTLLRHEFAHLLGLGHSSSRDDVMYPIVHDQLGYSPNDQAALLSSTTTCRSATAASAPPPAPT